MSIEVPATADRLSQIRRRLLAWIELIGIPDAVVADIVLAVNEAATNCVEHAYRDADDGMILVEAEEAGERIVVCVSDHGSWRVPGGQPSTRGRGLPIMEAMSDGVELAKSASGTMVKLSFAVTADERIRHD